MPAQGGGGVLQDAGAGAVEAERGGRAQRAGSAPPPGLRRTTRTDEPVSCGADPAPPRSPTQEAQLAVPDDAGVARLPAGPLPQQAQAPPRQAPWEGVLVEDVQTAEEGHGLQGGRPGDVHGEGGGGAAAVGLAGAVAVRAEVEQEAGPGGGVAAPGAQGLVDAGQGEVLRQERGEGALGVAPLLVARGVRAGAAVVAVAPADDAHAVAPGERFAEEPLEAAVGGGDLQGRLQGGLVVGQVGVAASHVGGDEGVRAAVGAVQVAHVGQVGGRVRGVCQPPVAVPAHGQSVAPEVDVVVPAQGGLRRPLEAGQGDEAPRRGELPLRPLLRGVVPVGVHVVVALVAGEVDPGHVPGVAEEVRDLVRVRDLAPVRVAPVEAVGAGALRAEDRIGARQQRLVAGHLRAGLYAVEARRRHGAAFEPPHPAVLGAEVVRRLGQAQPLLCAGAAQGDRPRPGVRRVAPGVHGPHQEAERLAGEDGGGGHEHQTLGLPPHDGQVRRSEEGRPLPAPIGVHVQAEDAPGLGEGLGAGPWPPAAPVADGEGEGVAGCQGGPEDGDDEALLVHHGEPEHGRGWPFDGEVLGPRRVVHLGAPPVGIRIRVEAHPPAGGDAPPSALARLLRRVCVAPLGQTRPCLVRR